ncbi:MAG: molybdopterin-dependent oxidoreductase, partial [Desulfobulbaceae bacterium]|nr:molybdopterin-dependent oxidoreductase [Desulfobulbaceae bacterium]
GLAVTFGSGAMTNSIAEIENTQVILVSGSNTTETHPQIARRIYDAVDKGAKLIVIDPRRTQLARHAHIHLQIRPGTDIPLLNAMMRSIVDENLVDDLFVEMRTENYFALRDKLFQVDIARSATTCGIDEEKIKLAARMYARAQRSVICYCLGVTQHVCGTDNVQSYANLAMLTGHVEQEFTGVDPLRGQNNVQGACDMGALPAVFPGYQSVTDPSVRGKFARAWGVKLPEIPGMTNLDMMHAKSGADSMLQPESSLRAMFIMGENPFISDPNLGNVRNTLHGLDFLAVTDLFLTDTARLADVVFPAVTFAEKSGTITNSERRVQLMHKAIEPVGSAWPDYKIIIELSRRFGYQMDYQSPAEIMEEICMLTPIYGGMYHDRLDAEWGLQWPCLDRQHGSTQYLHKYSFARGRGRFEPAEHIVPAESADEQYPLILITGRVYHHYHTGTMTRRSRLHNREYPKSLIEIHPEDAEKLAILEGDTIRVISRRGECFFSAMLTERVAPGHVFANFHFSESPVNLLTVEFSDPVAKCPEFKICAVRIEKV